MGGILLVRVDPFAVTARVDPRRDFVMYIPKKWTDQSQTGLGFDHPYARGTAGNEPV